MPIIKDDSLVSDDPWVFLEEDADAPSSGDVIIPLQVALEKQERLSNHSGRLGLFIENDADVEAYADLIARADLIVLHLPAFTDGRAYSQARLLREVMDYQNELRVKGDVLPDQAAYLKRCGFDSFDFDQPFDQDVWQKAVRSISTTYQRSYRDDLIQRSD